MARLQINANIDPYLPDVEDELFAKMLAITNYLCDMSLLCF